MKLRTKITLTSVIPLLTMLLLVAAVLINAFYKARMQTTWRQLRDTAELTAGRIGAETARASDIAAMIAHAQNNGLFGERALSVTYLRNVLELMPGITSAYVGYSADAEDADAGMADGGTDPRALGEGGRFVPYWFREIDNAGAISLEPLMDMESSYYYRGLENRSRGVPEREGIQLDGGISRLFREKPPSGDIRELRMITEPYVYRGKFVVEHTSPIIIDGQFKGIAGADRALDDIDAFLSRQRAFDSAEFILVSGRGRIISATASADLRGRLIEDTPYAELLELLYRTGEIRDENIRTDPLSGDDRLFVGTSIPVGDWKLLLSASRDEILEPVYHRVIEVILLFFAALTVATAVTVLSMRRVIKRVEQAATEVSRVADGDLTVQIVEESRDESGQILRAISSMVRSLDALIRQIKGSSLQLVSAATAISAAANRQGEVNHEFGASTAQIAASTNEITATSRALLETVTEVSRATAEAASVASHGRSDLAHMESTMAQLASATRSVSASLAVISERANKIGAVVTTITKVAEQTNLLSLNAAIEAEKAGEYGLGFSVVAREIRRLADQTAIATLDIDRIVSDMQSSVTRGVMEMDRFDERVREGVSETTRLGQQLTVIIDSVENLRPRFEVAMQSMQSQVIGAGQINEAIMQLREIALASGASSEELREAASQLLAAVDSLKTEVARFRTA